MSLDFNIFVINGVLLDLQQVGVLLDWNVLNNFGEVIVYGLVFFLYKKVCYYIFYFFWILFIFVGFFFYYLVIVSLKNKNVMLDII